MVEANFKRKKENKKINVSFYGIEVGILGDTKIFTSQIIIFQFLSSKINSDVTDFYKPNKWPIKSKQTNPCQHFKISKK